MSEWVEPVAGKPLTFRTKGVGKPDDVTVVAFHALPPQRYAIYWDLLTPEQGKKHHATLEAGQTAGAGLRLLGQRRRQARIRHPRGRREDRHAA